MAHLPPQVHITRADAPRATLASLGTAPPPDAPIPPPWVPGASNHCLIEFSQQSRKVHDFLDEGTEVES